MGHPWRSVIVGALLSGAFATATPAQFNLIPNGSFEIGEGTPTGQTGLCGPQGIPCLASWYPTDGLGGAWCGGTGSCTAGSCEGGDWTAISPDSGCRRLLLRVNEGIAVKLKAPLFRGVEYNLCYRVGQHLVESSLKARLRFEGLYDKGWKELFKQEIKPWDQFGEGPFHNTFKARKKFTDLRIVLEAGSQINLDSLTLSQDIYGTGECPLPNQTPLCVGPKGKFFVPVDELFTRMVTGYDPLDTLTLSSERPAGSSLVPPDGTTEPSPFEADFSWVPGLDELGENKLKFVFRDSQGAEGVCESFPTVGTCAPPPRQLQAWWRFDELSGTTALDAVTGFHAGFIGQPVRTAGRVNQGLHASASGHAAVKDAAGLNIGLSDFTVDAWIKKSDFSVDAGLCHVPDPSLEHWYALDENTGTTATDRAGTNDGTLAGTTAWVAGVSGSAVYFSGFHPALPGQILAGGAKHDVGTGNFTVDLWFKPDLILQGRPQTFLMGDIGQGIGYFLSLRAGVVRFEMHGSTGNSFVMESSQPFVDDAWNFIGVAVNRQQGVVDMNLNGFGENLLVDSNLGSLSNSDSLRIGGGLNVAIDEVEVFSAYLPGDLVRIHTRGKCKLPSESAQTILSKLTISPGGDTASTPGYALWLKQGKLALALAHAGDPSPGGGYTLHVFEGGPRLDNDIWHFVAATYERDEPDGIKLYVDGSVVGTFSSEGFASLSGTSSFRLGADTGGRVLNGVIDEVEVIRRTVEAEEIKGLYLAGNLGKCQNGVSVESAVSCCPGEYAASFGINVCNYSQEARTYRQTIIPTHEPGCEPFLQEDAFLYTETDFVLNPGECVNNPAFVQCGPVTNTGCFDVKLEREVGGLWAFVALARGKVHRQTNGCFNPSPAAANAYPRVIPTTSIGTVTFTIDNVALPAHFQGYIPYSIVAHSADGDDENAPVSLNGKSVGIPVTGWLQVAPGAQTNLSVNVQFKEHQPFDVHNIDLMIDTDGDGIQEIVASAPVRSLFRAPTSSPKRGGSTGLKVNSP